MDGSGLKSLRIQVGMSQWDLSQCLGISARTLSKWEAQNGDIPRPYVLAVRERFEDMVLRSILCEASKQAFHGIPSEWICIWLVRDLHAVLLKDVSRFQCLWPKERRGDCPWSRGCHRDTESCWRGDLVAKPLGERSLTTYPLRSGEIVNLAGDAISQHDSKKMPGRPNHFLKDGMCESLLHVPYLIPTDAGPRPVALLSLENKLECTGEKQWRVIIAPPGVTKVYTAEEEAQARELLKGLFTAELGELLAALDY